MMSMSGLLHTKERDPKGLSSKEPGAKLDAGKAPIYQGVIDYFPRAVVAVANLSAYGANKYSWKGWEKVDNGFKRYSDAMGRHLTKESTEGLYDLEVLHDPKYPAHILHATQVAWNAMARLELLLRSLSGASAQTRGEQMDPVPLSIPDENLS